MAAKSYTFRSAKEPFLTQRDPFLMNLIISGSVTSGYGLSPEIPRWDKVFRDQLPELTFETVCTDGMTHENALNILRNSKINGDTLILYFGTRIGWPRIGNSFSRFFPYKIKNGGYLDLPVFNSVAKGARMRRILRRISRILIKSLGILFKQYKPDLPKDKVLKDLDLLLTFAASNFNRVIYIQHHHLSTKRLKYESNKYENYYSLLLGAVRLRFESNIVLIEMPKDIFAEKFFLPDGVHFSNLGQRKFGIFLAEIMKALLKEK
jgi:hypothetical protein